MSENGKLADANSKLRIMLIHDVPVVRTGLRAIINAESDMVVVGEAEDREDALHLVEELKPHVIVTDVCVDGLAGLETIRTVRKAAPWVKILVLSYQKSSEHFSMAMKAGADGYLTREAQPGEVVNAIRSVSKGQNYVNPSIVTLLVNTYFCKTRRGAWEDPYDLLTDREREILYLAAAGYTNREIAQILHLSEQTVHNNRARLMEKLGFRDRLQLLKYAIRRGIISTEEM